MEDLPVLRQITELQRLFIRDIQSFQIFPTLSPLLITKYTTAVQVYGSIISDMMLYQLQTLRVCRI
jgi:hypothetical protein